MSKPFADIDAIRATQDGVRKEPALGNVTFKLQGKSSGGLTFSGATGPLVQNSLPSGEGQVQTEFPAEGEGDEPQAEER